ncbi:hypothetical protein [uncultured Sphingorhabdus sp.]|uniref:hypothetical protein n=1 Tax=uncultured Sphingorhabdus sp. TaxID=1686106 RepID=UPI0026285DA7|nr:hypothetical protein [uncultured Sphingorhabdus sp.]
MRIGAFATICKRADVPLENWAIASSNLLRIGRFGQFLLGAELRGMDELQSVVFKRKVGSIR